MLCKGFIILILTLTVSCNTYRSQFDCCPSTGMPCTSVSEIESKVIETEEGPDLFVGLQKPGQCLWKVKVFACEKDSIKKVWIEDAMDSCGNLICGHYIYLQD